MKQKLFLILLISLFPAFILSQNYKVLESTSSFIKISFDFSNRYNLKDTLIDGKVFTYISGEAYSIRKPGEPWLPAVYLNVGIPFNSKPSIKILQLEQESYPQHFMISYPDSLNQSFSSLKFDENIYGNNSFFPKLPAELSSDFTMRYAHATGFIVYPYQFNPVSRDLVLNKKITIQIDFNSSTAFGVVMEEVNDDLTNDFIESSIINSQEAKKFVGKVRDYLGKTAEDAVWYKPQKNYFKIYLKEKGLYKITYNQLVSAGVPENEGLTDGKLELINNGYYIPLDIIDENKDGLFNSGDYFKFVGYPPKPTTPYTYSNIYNHDNVYWFSYQADSVNKYKYIDGFPTNFDNTVKYSRKTIHFEQDLLYERLGYAPDDKRDFWLWGTAEARSGQPFDIFTYWMSDDIVYFFNENKPDVTLRVNMQGITNIYCPNGNGHSAFVKFNTNPVGEAKWNGQNSITFESNFTVNTTGVAGIPLYSSQNKVEVGLDGQVCASSGDDIARVNWFEFDYWRWNLVKGNKIIFTSPSDRIGKNTFYLYGWFSDNMKIYIPSRGELITNPRIANDADYSVHFADSIGGSTEYFCYADEAFLTPDSITRHVPSDLRNIANGADYIIITHPNFMSIAERLAAYRSVNLPGYESPRVKIVNVLDIYDEFSYGMLDPYALKYFVRYAFQNWQAPAPAFVVLLGDMSYDYRPIYATNRPNFVPSIPYQSTEFGQAPSDNEVVCVTGDDIVPDLAIGRLSCETVEEGNILLDKIINYPADNSKAWKENVLLMSSGLNSSDEYDKGFNDESLYLDDNYLITNGFTSAKVFRFPNKPRHFPFQGEGPKIREEFNRGAIIANYYGHGGGGQWDLVFTNDDIYQLDNGDRLPLVISVTCYTAHFDNQDIFGEKFNKVPGKGSVAFFGSSGLTWWQAGTYINKELFKEIFDRRNYVFGLAVLKAKQAVPAASYVATQISLLTLLGDPALELAFPKFPDFEIKSADISIEPQNPVKDDTVSIFLKYRNLGVNFPQDSVTIQVFENSISPEALIGEVKRGSFGQTDSIQLLWIPKNAGLRTLIVHVNESDTLWEIDHSDNTATSDFAIYSFGKPNIVRPINGHFQNSDRVDFIFADIGTFFGRNFSYVIEIDTSRFLNSSLKVTSPILNQTDGIVQWRSPALAQGEYFWRATIYDETDTNTSFLNTFAITNTVGAGYYSKNNQLKNFQTENMFFSESSKSLVLNTDTLPPYPSNKRFLDSTNITLPSDIGGITALATDGSYFYFGHLPYYVLGKPTKIYRIGTGLNGTVRGLNYGSIPDLLLNIKSQMFFYNDGFIYVATGDDGSLLKLNPNNGDTSRIFLPEKLLPTQDGLLKDGGYYITSDGKLVYNLSAGYGDRRYQYTMRIFDPQHGWQQVGNDIFFDGSASSEFTNFFVTQGYLIVYESFNGYMRRYRISDGFFEEQWLSSDPFRGYYAFCYDWINNFVFASTFRPGTFYKPGFHKFVGVYQEAIGSATSEEIGPSVKWKNAVYEIDATGSTGNYNVNLLGKNVTTSAWDTLAYDIPTSFSLENITASNYDYLKIHFNFIDSSYSPSAPMKLKSLLVNYDANPEIVVSARDLIFSSDTLLQGFPIDMELKVRNIGYSVAEKLNLKFYLNDADSAYISDFINLAPDSVKVIKHTIPTSNLIFDNKIKVVSTSSVPEFYTFNNITENSFFVARDSIKPFFSITVDGKEIVNGDIVSAKPEILITLKDDSPLPLDTTLFTVIYNNVPLSFSRPDVQYTYTPYPNSQATIKWTPTLKDGRHTLEVLAKDASGNFFDTTSSRTVFYVYNQPNLLYMYNYPNPFKNDTYFTFELRGTVVPDEFLIKIYTVAGRLIKEISVPSSTMNIGFNRIYWDGRDEDGDEISNGIYFYKVISRLNNETKIITEKLAKVK